MDCQGVVNTINDFISNGHTAPLRLNEADLWERIFEVVKSSPEEYYKFQWMPSHLDEPKNSEKRKRALESGIIEEVDISGNNGADKRAGDGALMHPSNKGQVQNAKHRKDIIVIVQKVYLEI